MIKNNVNKGKQGESIAQNFLENLGIIILCKNYYKNKGEIDIVAKDNDTIVFVEVKLRTTLEYGHPLEAITHRKIMKLKEVAQCYLIENGLIDYSVRFDVVSIVQHNRQTEIEHIVNAF